MDEHQWISRIGTICSRLSATKMFLSLKLWSASFQPWRADSAGIFTSAPHHFLSFRNEMQCLNKGLNHSLGNMFNLGNSFNSII